LSSTARSTVNFIAAPTPRSLMRPPHRAMRGRWCPPVVPPRTPGPNRPARRPTEGAAPYQRDSRGERRETRWAGQPCRQAPGTRQPGKVRQSHRIARTRDPGAHSATAPNPPVAQRAPAHGAKASRPDGRHPPAERRTKNGSRACAIRERTARPRPTHPWPPARQCTARKPSRRRRRPALEGKKTTSPASGAAVRHPRRRRCRPA